MVPWEVLSLGRGWRFAGVQAEVVFDDGNPKDKGAGDAFTFTMLWEGPRASEAKARVRLARFMRAQKDAGVVTDFAVDESVDVGMDDAEEPPFDVSTPGAVTSAKLKSTSPTNLVLGVLFAPAFLPALVRVVGDILEDDDTREAAVSALFQVSRHPAGAFRIANDPQLVDELLAHHVENAELPLKHRAKALTVLLRCSNTKGAAHVIVEKHPRVLDGISALCQTAPPHHSHVQPRQGDGRLCPIRADRAGRPRPERARVSSVGDGQL